METTDFIESTEFPARPFRLGGQPRTSPPTPCRWGVAFCESANPGLRSALGYRISPDSGLLCKPTAANAADECLLFLGALCACAEAKRFSERRAYIATGAKIMNSMRRHEFYGRFQRDYHRVQRREVVNSMGAA